MALITPPPASAVTLVRRARALLAARRAAAALCAFEEAARRGADPMAIAEEHWTAAMLAGAFDAAWRVSDRVLSRRSASDYGCQLPYHRRAVWDGRPLHDRHVLLCCFHGLGDTIQFVRFAPLLAGLARDVTLEAQEELLPLLAATPGITRLVPLGGAGDGYEAAIEAMELPHALRIGLGDLPGPIPSLAVEPERVAAWRSVTAPADSRLRVGLVWAAGDWDPRRSLPIAALAGLSAISGVTLYSLQRGPAAAVPRRGAPVFARAEEAPADLRETAALILALDLVVTVDTMVAHLAGALGRPVWTLLHFAADWRWMEGRGDSPWYPTMRLFRQARPGDWSGVVRRVERALARLAAQSRRSRLR